MEGRGDRSRGRIAGETGPLQDPTAPLRRRRRGVTRSRVMCLVGAAVFGAAPQAPPGPEFPRSRERVWFARPTREDLDTNLRKGVASEGVNRLDVLVPPGGNAERFMVEVEMRALSELALQILPQAGASPADREPGRPLGSDPRSGEEGGDRGARSPVNVGGSGASTGDRRGSFSRGAPGSPRGAGPAPRVTVSRRSP